MCVESVSQNRRRSWKKNQDVNFFLKFGLISLKKLQKTLSNSSVLIFLCSRALFSFFSLLFRTLTDILIRRLFFFAISKRPIRGFDSIKHEMRRLLEIVCLYRPNSSRTEFSSCKSVLSAKHNTKGGNMMKAKKSIRQHKV